MSKTSKASKTLKTPRGYMLCVPSAAAEQLIRSCGLPSIFIPVVEAYRKSVACSAPNLGGCLSFTTNFNTIFHVTDHRDSPVVIVVFEYINTRYSTEKEIAQDRKRVEQLGAELVELEPDVEVLQQIHKLYLSRC